jgi:xylan 1,4-beta-xylosidase
MNKILLYFSLLLSTFTSCGTEKSEPYTFPDPPIKNLQFGDPYILVDNGTYYAYGTSSDDGIQVYKSSDMVNWEGPCGVSNGFALQKKDVWGDKWFWAPEVFKVNGKFYMYFSVEEHIAVATSDSPLGPFVQDVQKPMLETKAIDNTLFIDNDGKKYLYFVQFDAGNTCWVAELSDDLMTIKKETMKRCISQSQDWERSTKEPIGVVNEGPCILKHKGLYYLVYSANHYASQDYGVGFATATNPMGPWTKYAGNPILKTKGEQYGPGHCQFFTDVNGQLRMVYHTHSSKLSVQPRKVYINPCQFTQIGTSGDYKLEVIAPMITPILKNSK